MSVAENKALLRRYLDAWGKGDVSQLRAMLHEDCTTPNLVTGEKRGIEFEVGACEIWHAAFSAVTLEIVQIVAEGDKVTVHWLLASTHTGDFMGIEATGKKVKVPGMEVNHVQDGKIIEIWRLSDTMSLMQQLDAV